MGMSAYNDRTDLPVLLLHNLDLTWSSSDREEAEQQAGKLKTALRDLGHPVASVPVVDANLAPRLRDDLGHPLAIRPDLKIEISAKPGSIACLGEQRREPSRVVMRGRVHRERVADRTDAPVELETEALRVRAPDVQALSGLFRELEFRQLQQSLPQASDLSRKDYRAVLDAGELSALIERLRAAGMFAIDTETTSRNPMRAGLVGLSVAVQADQAFYIPCGHRYLGAPRQLERGFVLEQLKPLLEDPRLRKVGQNIKYDGMVLARHGVALEGVVFDTMLASYLLDPSKRAHNLDQIALDFLDHKTIAFEDLVGKRKGVATFAEVPLETAAPYACEDADITLMAHDVLSRRLEEVGLTALMTAVEMPLVPVLMRMEMRGVAVDIERLHELSKSFAQQLEALEAGIYGIAGERFNINSS
jgi:DNA polymerase-1